MKKLYVAWQDFDSREWIPVAILERDDNGYLLRYTSGARRCRSFDGIGRMSDLEKAYLSKTIFPFFKNRIISKSRPEYKDYISWLDLDASVDDPMVLLGRAGGLRATDLLEIVLPPEEVNGRLVLDFFPRGLRHFPKSSLDAIAELSSGDTLFLVKDVQNSFDRNAFIIRTGDPKVLIGYVPKYYCSGISRLLDRDCEEVRLSVKKVNRDAPLDFRYSCTLTAPWVGGFQFLECENDFTPLECNGVELASEKELSSITSGLDGFKID